MADPHLSPETSYGLISVASTDFWYMLAFLLFIGFLGKPIFKLIAGMLDKRSKAIADSLDEARALREEAQELLATYKRKQRDALEEAEQLLNEAKTEARRLRDEAVRDLEQSVKMREQQALQKIALAEKEAMHEVQRATADIAIAAAREIIADKLSGPEAAKVTEQAIAALPKSLNA